MSRRKSLTGLLSAVDDEVPTEIAAVQPPVSTTEPATDRGADPAAERAPEPAPAATPRKRPSAKTTPATPGDAREAGGPRYLELTRKEARFTDEQLAQLSVLTRSLNKSRRGRGERITDNTLIRVAVDLLIHRGEDLAGYDENTLRKSVGL